MVSGNILGDDIDSQHWQEIFIFMTVQSSSGPSLSPVQWGLEAFSLEVKRPGHEAKHLPPSHAEVKNSWSCTSCQSYHM
jgi:hypothetical protein